MVCRRQIENIDMDAMMGFQQNEVDLEAYENDATAQSLHERMFRALLVVSFTPTLVYIVLVLTLLLFSHHALYFTVLSTRWWRPDSRAPVLLGR